MNDKNVLFLKAKCEQRRADNSHEPYCYELFRRAIVERDDASWHIVYQRYYPMVRHWVRQSSKSNHIDADDLAQDALLSFWRSYNAEKLAHATELGHILGFLKSCAKTAILQQHRTASRRPQTEPFPENRSEESPFSNPVDIIETQQQRRYIWEQVEARCNDKRDLILADAVFKRGMKTSEIAAHYPDLFSDSGEVSYVYRKLKDRVWRNQNLRDLLK